PYAADTAACPDTSPPAAADPDPNGDTDASADSDSDVDPQRTARRRRDANADSDHESRLGTDGEPHAHPESDSRANAHPGADATADDNVNSGRSRLSTGGERGPGLVARDDRKRRDGRGPRLRGGGGSRSHPAYEPNPRVGQLRGSAPLKRPGRARDACRGDHRWERQPLRG